jgi:hypothetical protein
MTEFRLDEGTAVTTVIGNHVYATDDRNAKYGSDVREVFMEWDDMSQESQDQLEELQGTLKVHAMKLKEFILSLTPLANRQNILIDGVLRSSGFVKPKESSGCSLPSSSEVKTFEASGDGLYWYVGELRDAATGEVVVDLECPF